MSRHWYFGISAICVGVVAIVASPADPAIGPLLGMVAGMLAANADFARRET